MRTSWSRFEAGVERIGRNVVIISAVGILIMMLLTTVDVTRRALIDRPISGVLEISELVLVFVVFAGLAYCQQMNGHVAVDLMSMRLGTRKRVLMKAVALAISIVFFAVIAYGAVSSAYLSTSVGEYSYGLIPFPKWPGKVLLAVGLLLFWLQLCIGFVRVVRATPKQASQEGNG